jgi:RNA polymerase sigma-70 factor (ECF subfamily)
LSEPVRTPIQVLLILLNHDGKPEYLRLRTRTTAAVRLRLNAHLLSGTDWGFSVTTDMAHLLSDHDLVAEAQAGDPVALDRLIAAVRPVAFRYCRSRLATYAGGLDAADDAAQETCVAVLRALPRYRREGAAPFAAFVYAIASNKVADTQRRFGRSAVLVDEFPEQTEPSLNPEEQAIAAVDVATAGRLLALLPTRMREVLLHRSAGLSAEVVGEHLDMSPNAVRVTQHRAILKLRQLIEESDEHREVFDDYRRSVA